ncbi:Phosphatidylinositol-glycan biosynthesis class X protein [Dufourea novaeangliae]|uniref:Phosphatidylinositol-glycan biosynthesis class X protein n=1 Tax=Dufourea novaeangliae TaxID=178035 RepID=A0A154PBW0_DUFNO|nr:Phosphatidylinositol-glycan biosynthesis class X protein [Dufourea novaeangliae]
MILSRIKRYFVQINLFSILIFEDLVVCEKLNAQISLTTEGEGFHRSLIYHINFDASISDCYIALHLQLPSALYVSVAELSDIRRLGINIICSIGESNIELFMEKAELQNVTICSPLCTTESVFKFPIHQRYQYANETSRYMSINIPKPNILLGCTKRIKEYRTSIIDVCSPCVNFVNKWREIPYTMDTENVVWMVPIGNLSVLTIVTSTTLLLTVLCTMFLMQTICKHVLITHKKEE